MTEQGNRRDEHLEHLAAALLRAARGTTEPDRDGIDELLTGFKNRAIDLVRGYNRLGVELEAENLTDPVMFVANHGFGGIFDLNVLAVGAALQDLHLDRPVTVLTHQLAWTLGVGPLVERFGARPASQASAAEAFAAGHHVAVFPGGDLDAFKSWSHRDEIIFGGRSGFARLAIEQQVPIVPVVTAGGAESLIVLTDGARLARALQFDKLLRLKALPITVSIPWGINIGGVGLLPYLPLPAKLHTKVLAPMPPTADDDADSYADRVHTAMQNALTAMTRHRRPFLG